MSYVLDANVVLYHLSGRLADPLPKGQISVSIVTEIELLAFKSLSREESDRVRAFLSGVAVVPLVNALKQDVVDMRLGGLRLPDAIIAATALSVNAELLTHDARLLRLTTISVSAPPLKS